MTLLHGEDIHHVFAQGDTRVEVLRGVDVSLNSAETLAIVGASGSGKTTLLQILGGLEKPSRGKVSLQDRDLHNISETRRAQMRSRQLGFVYQFHHLLPEYSALENVAMPLLIAGYAATKVEEQAKEILTAVAMEHRLQHKPTELSGGERQRVAVARALVAKPSLVLCDEPTGNLDQETAADLQQLIKEINIRFGTAFIVVTHDLEFAASLQRCLRLSNGLLQSC